MIWGFRGMGRWSGKRGENLLDTGAHFYDTFECADGKWVSLGAIEPQFYAELRAVMRLDAPEWDRQMDPRAWRPLKAELERRFRERTRDEWVAAFAGHEVCFAPVLDFDEALADPHNRARGTFVEAGGVTQPAPAPRYSGSETVPPAMAGEREDAGVLREFGFSGEEIAALGH
jgi:alpha-methylacyl-CoA racemase